VFLLASKASQKGKISRRGAERVLLIHLQRIKRVKKRKPPGQRVSPAKPEDYLRDL